MSTTPPEKPVIEWPMKDRPDGWDFLFLDRDKDPLCGWTTDGTFVAWATAEEIALAARDALIEMQAQLR